MIQKYRASEVKTLGINHNMQEIKPQPSQEIHYSPHKQQQLCEIMNKSFGADMFAAGGKVKRGKSLGGVALRNSIGEMNES